MGALEVLILVFLFPCFVFGTTSYGKDPDPRCKHIGQYLKDGYDKCSYLVCTYGDEPWYDAYGKIQLFTTKQYCAGGTEIPEDFNGYDNPCSKRSYECQPKVTFSYSAGYGDKQGNRQGYGYQDNKVYDNKRYGNKRDSKISYGYPDNKKGYEGKGYGYQNNVVYDPKVYRLTDILRSYISKAYGYDERKRYETRVYGYNDEKKGFKQDEYSYGADKGVKYDYRPDGYGFGYADGKKEYEPNVYSYEIKKTYKPVSYVYKDNKSRNEKDIYNYLDEKKRYEDSGYGYKGYESRSQVSSGYKGASGGYGYQMDGYGNTGLSRGFRSRSGIKSLLSQK